MHCVHSIQHCSCTPPTVTIAKCLKRKSTSGRLHTVRGWLYYKTNIYVTYDTNNMEGELQAKGSAASGVRAQRTSQRLLEDAGLPFQDTMCQPAMEGLFVDHRVAVLPGPGLVDICDRLPPPRAGLHTSKGAAKHCKYTTKKN